MQTQTRPFALSINNGRYVVLFAVNKADAIRRFNEEYRCSPDEKADSVREV